MTPSEASDLARYRYTPAQYIHDKLGWTPWSGQEAVLNAYADAVRMQIEQPGKPVNNRIRVESGHGIGKTKLSSGIVNHFFDCFTPSIIYTYAPTSEQVKLLLWKEIKADRKNKGLPGTILPRDPEMYVSDNHFAIGRATSDAGGTGTERLQGQHGPFLMFVLDEAEGIPDYVWTAVDAMTTGGVSIVLTLANPRTRLSRFYREREAPSVQSFRISCLDHPNVVEGREVVPGAVSRKWVEDEVDKRCEVVRVHNAERHTFELPWRPGIVYEPRSDDEGQRILYRVFGIPPALSTVDTFIPVGRYEAAVKRLDYGDGNVARFGVDAARWGNDHGTLYVRHGGRCWRAARLTKQDSFHYVAAIKDAALPLISQGVTSLHVRVDGSGGFGSGVVDLLNADSELNREFADFQCVEVQFGGNAHNTEAYDNVVTEMYAEAAESLKGVALDSPPPQLEADLCERKYELVNVHGTTKKRLEDKQKFRKRVHRSPDDGDGCVLALAPDYLFSGRGWSKESLGSLSSGKKL